MNVLHSNNDEIACIVRGLVPYTLPKSHWTHSTHFAAALWFLHHSSYDETLCLLRDSIRAYNEEAGVVNTGSSGYRETITQASLCAASHFRCARQSSPLYVVCNDLLTSPFGTSDWMLRYWTRERLFTPEARTRWVDPDVRDLPF
jgi:hypothetical protein